MSTLDKRNPIAKAVRTALFATAAAGFVAAPNTFAAEVEADEEDEQKVTITGSRIKRTDIESATPISIISAEDMAQAGRYSVADALRDSTANQFGSFNERSGSSAQSQATISLLGAGADRTLVLLDGKRLPGSPSLGGTSVNLNQIPTAMVERIEIQRDGGSAVYGSDAIAGVVNVVLKEDFEGLNISGQVGRPDKEGGDTDQFSMALGVSGEKGNITFAFEHQSSGAIFDKDRPYTAAFAEDLNGDGVIQAYTETDGNSLFGATIVAPDFAYTLAAPQCADLTANVDGFLGEIAADDDWGPGSTYCMYSYGNVSANKASQKRNSVFVNANYEINDNLEFFSRALMMHNQSFGRYAPPAAWWRDIPRDDPKIPQQLRDDYPTAATFDGLYRWTTIGTRDNNIDDYSQDYILGFRGTTDSDSMLEWETYLHYNLTDNKSIGEFYQSIGGLAHNLANGIDLGSPQGIANLKATTLNNDRNQFLQFFIGAGFEAGELSGGAWAHYVGAEYFDIDYQSKVDAQSEAGLVGGSAGNSSGADRQIKAFFYETNLPFTEELNLNIAVRHDDYSDFGSETSPSVKLEYRPNDELLLRASWGEGFRAPTLSELTQADAFSAEDATDYVQCANRAVPVAPDLCPTRQQDTTVQSNANLGAETSTFLNIGGVYSITDDMSITVDFFDLQVDDVIQYISVQDLIFQELVNGDTFDPNTNYVGYTRAGGPGTPIVTAFTGTVNGPGFDIQGVNLNFQGKMDMGPGSFGWNWETSVFTKYASEAFFNGPVQDSKGWGLQPDLRSQIQFTYEMGDHSFAWNSDYIDSTYEASAPEIVGGQATGRLTPFGNLDSFMTHNISYSYNAGDWGRYTLGVRNLTDEEPILDSQGKYPRGHFDLYTPGHLGQTIYVNYSIDL